MKSSVFSILLKIYKIHSIAHNKSIALFQGTDETLFFFFSGCYSVTTGGVVRPCAGVTKEVVLSVGGVKASVAAHFYLLVGFDTRLKRFLIKLLWTVSSMSGQCV